MRRAKGALVTCWGRLLLGSVARPLLPDWFFASVWFSSSCLRKKRYSLAAHALRGLRTSDDSIDVLLLADFFMVSHGFHRLVKPAV